MQTACHNVYTLTAYVTGFRKVLVTPHALVYERNAASQLTDSKVNAPVAGRLRNFCFSFESNSLINQYKLIALFNIII